MADKNMKYCEICMEYKSKKNMVEHKNCSHIFCSKCIISYAKSKVEENTVSIKCPNLKCVVLLERELLQPLLPEKVIERWDRALSESLINGSTRFYCPYKDCSAILVMEDAKHKKEVKCMRCQRLFCVPCKVPSHSGFECSEFQAMNTEDQLVMELAKLNLWKRCPSCKHMVDKTHGCSHIQCRCRYEFCYSCGSTWNGTHEIDCRRE